MSAMYRQNETHATEQNMGKQMTNMFFTDILTFPGILIYSYTVYIGEGQGMVWCLRV